MKKPVLLAILDGVGSTKNKHGNATRSEWMPFMEYARNNFSSTTLQAAEEAVGLPPHQMGNSEVGHLHIGAGRIQNESLLEINNAIQNHSFEENPALLQSIKQAEAKQSVFHIVGLCSDGGVHSHINHMIATYNILKKYKIKRIYFHLIGDGRDTAPQVFDTYLVKIQTIIKNDETTAIASISGRYYTMDRDKRFDRIKLAFDAIVNAKGKHFNNPLDYVQQQFHKKINDEFLIPAYNSAINYQGFINNDVVFFTNFRPDRAVQFNSALSNDNYLFYPTRKVQNIFLLTMKKYSSTVKENAVCFKQHKLNNTLGSWLSQHHQKQLRIAETEKIAHVTFFLDGGDDYFKNGLAQPNEITLPGADCCLIPSLKIATYDLDPRMSANKITDALLAKLKNNPYDFIALNFANGDMVGHTGYYKATQKACHIIDNCLNRITVAIEKIGGTMIITADHGNAEIMLDEHDQPNKKHTLNPVDFIICNKKYQLQTTGDIGLSNVAPTVLDIMQIKQPSEMTRKSLIIKKI